MGKAAPLMRARKATLPFSVRLTVDSAPHARA